MPRRRGYRDWYYDRFAEDEEETEDEAFESIASDVDHIWRSKWWSKNMRDDESQWGLITAMQKKYIYPDYLDLVGPPGPEDYRAEGHLTTSRARKGVGDNQESFAITNTCRICYFPKGSEQRPSSPWRDQDATETTHVHAGSTLPCNPARKQPGTLFFH